MSGDLFVAGLVVAVALLVANRASRVTGVPYPVFLVIAGLAISVLPGVPTPQLQPQVVFLGFLPPLVYWAAFVASPEEFAANWESIGLLAVGLVLATTAAVAAMIELVVPSVGWAPAFVLGAVVASTDSVAPGAVLKRVGTPQRITTILEGESLINDGVALVIYSLAVSAVVSGGFSVAHGLAEFAREVGISLGLGLAVGAVARLLRRRIVDADAQIILSLMTPYVAYIPASRLGASGVLATVTTGLYVGWRTSGMVPAATRLRAHTFWDVLVYLLNAVLFLLLGAQFTTVVAGLDRDSAWDLTGYAAAAAATVIVLRLAWMLAVPPVIARIRAFGKGEGDLAPLRGRLLIGWSGMRGAVSLAAALSIPLTAGHRPFPSRPLLVFLTFCVILATLGVQGGALPWVIRLLGVTRRDRQSRAETFTRQRLAQAALVRLDELTADNTKAQADADDGHVPPNDLGPLREIYEDRLARCSGQLEDGTDATKTDTNSLRLREQRLNQAWREAITAERAELQRLYRTSQVDNETMHRLQRELDLDEVRRQH